MRQACVVELHTHGKYNLARLKRPRWVLVGAFSTVALLVVFFIVGVGAPPGPSFSFVTVDHPVDMWQDGTDRWAYFSWGQGNVGEVANRARKELLPQGFKEDFSEKPWFRFIKDRVEVVICSHYQFGSLPNPRFVGSGNRGSN